MNVNHLLKHSKLSLDINDPVLVTGATGFIGSHLVRKLLGLGKKTHIIVRHSSDKWRITEISSKLQEHFADLRDGPAIRRVIKLVRPKVIFHCAAYGVRTFEADTDKIFGVNLLGTIKLLESACAEGVDLFINTGSFFEYGTAKISTIDEVELNAESSYTASKFASTLYCAEVGQKSNCKVITLRLFYPYGPFESSHRLIPHVVRTCLTGGPLYFTQGNQKRDFVYIDDVIEAYIKAAQIGNGAGHIINIGSGIGYSVKEVVGKLIQLLDSKTVPNWGKIQMRQFEMLSCEANISMASEMLGWYPTVGLDEGLQMTVEWLTGCNNQRGGQ